MRNSTISDNLSEELWLLVKFVMLAMLEEPAVTGSITNTIINSTAAVAAIYMLVMLVKAVSTLVEQVRKKPEGSGVPSVVHTDHSAPLAISNVQLEKLEQILRILQDLYKMHDHRDEQGRLVWYSTPVVAAARDHFALQQSVLAEMRVIREQLQDLHSNVRSITKSGRGL